jgi:hypothetical protein
MDGKSFRKTKPQIHPKLESISNMAMVLLDGA